MIGSAGLHDELLALENDNTVWHPPETAAPDDFTQYIFVPAWDNQPEARKPVVELANVKILSQGNISMITAGAGTGKSSLLEAGCASAITPMIDTLGIVFHSNTVLYIDTERSIYDHHVSWQRFMRRAGMEKDTMPPGGVRWENIRGIETLENRLNYLWSRIDVENATELVIIDGIGDFIADPNDSEECTALVSRLCSVVHNHDIALMLTLHNNPAVNSTKARGVLGSELWRKCESVLIIEKLAEGVRRVTTDYALGKNRSASDTLASCFKWDDELKMHVSCELPKEDTTGRASKTRKERGVLAGLLDKRPLPYSEYVAAIMKESGIRERAAKDRIKDLVTAGFIQKENGIYQRATIPEHWSAGNE
jgi:hypothetical protein